MVFPFDWPQPERITPQWPPPPETRMEKPCPLCKRPNDINYHNQFIHTKCWSCGGPLPLHVPTEVKAPPVKVCPACYINNAPDRTKCWKCGGSFGGYP
jgi:hypothetical protein